MPAQSIWMLRLSLIYFLIAVIAGGFLLIHKSVVIHPVVWSLLPVHFEMAIWGWIVQFVMGTAYWMFPRYLEGEIRGPGGMAWWMVILFNTGLILLLAVHLQFLIQLFALAGRFLMFLGISLFGFLMWKRVISYRMHDQ